MCVISDKSGVLGLGGIIGGTTTSTELDTKNILLERRLISAHHQLEKQLECLI